MAGCRSRSLARTWMDLLLPLPSRIPTLGCICMSGPSIGMLDSWVWPCPCRAIASPGVRRLTPKVLEATPGSQSKVAPLWADTYRQCDGTPCEQVTASGQLH
ncbi:hypothetical protein B0T26DRAFT_278042 [Lasiosphaeria miniovina]|uniref:Uncharacterized protein n=1 Tax=Lasiosphaeria miniovina TaxID=1954250 RepID=A0AA40DZB5_9PEZI|nr:uncharacterized protein B0T26DRAFT_278042 [Lasiosphaeria miniovina]KAK0717063.1 hypothetical protein B0T26DRAFT_278042 [Lasiosphaeria miniovina]